MKYNRKQLRQITGLPDKTLRWLLNRLDIIPVDIERTVFGSPVYIYDESALAKLHEYIFKRQEQKEEYAKGKRCRGGCNRYLPTDALNSQQICSSCRRRNWLINEIFHNDPVCNEPDQQVIADIQATINHYKTQ